MTRQQQKAMFAKSANLRFIDSPKFSSNKLPVQVAVVVPATTDEDKKLSEAQFKKRVDSEKRFMSKTFGGDTAIKGEGGFLLEGKLIKEKVVKVESSMSVADYNRNRQLIAKHVAERRKAWKQNSILVEVEGQTFITPKQSFISDDKKQSSKILVT